MPEEKNCLIAVCSRRQTAPLCEQHAAEYETSDEQELAARVAQAMFSGFVRRVNMEDLGQPAAEAQPARVASLPAQFDPDGRPYCPVRCATDREGRAPMLAGVLGGTWRCVHCEGRWTLRGGKLRPDVEAQPEPAQFAAVVR